MRRGCAATATAATTATTAAATAATGGGGGGAGASRRLRRPECLRRRPVTEVRAVGRCATRAHASSTSCRGGTNSRCRCRVSGHVSFCVKVAAIDVNDELFATWTMYSMSAVTPLRLPAFTLNSGVRSVIVVAVRGVDGIGGASTTSASTLKLFAAEYGPVFAPSSARVRHQ